MAVVTTLAHCQCGTERDGQLEKVNRTVITQTRNLSDAACHWSVRGDVVYSQWFPKLAIVSQNFFFSCVREPWNDLTFNSTCVGLVRIT